MSLYDVTSNQVEFDYDGLQEAWPPVDPQHAPYGPYVVVQIRAPKTITKGGVLLVADAIRTEEDTTQVAKVVAIGPLAFHDRETGAPWPGGPWYHIGDYVRAPKYGGDRWRVPFARKQPEKMVNGLLIPGSSETVEVLFALFMERDIRVAVTGDPLKIRAYVE